MTRCAARGHSQKYLRALYKQNAVDAGPGVTVAEVVNNPGPEQVFGRDRPDHKQPAQVGCDLVVLPGPKRHQSEP